MFIVEKSAYNLGNKDKYNQEKRECRNRFKEALEKEFGIENHPNRGLLFDKVWDRGRSEGFESVLDSYEDLVELLQ